MTDLEQARDAFLNMIADTSVWEEQPDGDMNDAGRMIDCTTFKIITGTRQLEELVEALGIDTGQVGLTKTLKDVIDEAVAAPTAQDLREAAANADEARKIA